VPTANLDPELCGGEEFFSTLPLGVFFGWAKLAGESAWHECVLNVGKRPTFVDGDGTTIEVHVMGSTDATPEYDRDFYGETMRVDVCGFIRPELRFDSLPELVARIKADIGLARNALASGAHARPTANL
jgi:riboflavin kinase